MNTYKRVDGDYTIVSINETDKVVIDSNLVSVTGNLSVDGDVTGYVSLTTLKSVVAASSSFADFQTRVSNL